MTLTPKISETIKRIQKLRPQYLAALASPEIDLTKPHSQNEILRAALAHYEQHITQYLARVQPKNGQLFET